jgi:1-deoxy-D-xylulose-5-phosphate synthase
VRDIVKHLTLKAGGVFGDGVVEFAKNVERAPRTSSLQGMFFEELGFRYFGPIDGHDVQKLCETMHFVRGLTGPRVVHVHDRKGQGFSARRGQQGEVARLAAYDPVTGEARKKASGPPTWTQVFGDAITALAAESPDFAVITAAMPSGTGYQHLPEETGRTGSSTWASPRARGDLRRGLATQGSVRSAPSTAPSCSGPTTTSSTMSRCSSFR